MEQGSRRSPRQCGYTCKAGRRSGNASSNENLEAEATCVTIPLPESLRGPKHVAEHIMEEQRKLGRILNDEQKMLYVLWVDILEDAFQRRPNHEGPWIPPDTWLFDIIVDGGGGCGKTVFIN